MLRGIEEEAAYFCHPDHLGSVSVVSNHKGEPYERVEYLPFGEVWIEEVDPATGYIPFRFTSKELDRETGLYYYGARYYEPKFSRWMSADPAGFEVIDPRNNEQFIISGINLVQLLRTQSCQIYRPRWSIAFNCAWCACRCTYRAIVGGVSAVLQGNTSFREIAGGVAGGALSGAVTGALVGSGVGLLALVGGSFVGGAGASLMENAITGEAKNMNAKELATDTLVDGGISALAAIAAVGSGKVISKAVEKIPGSTKILKPVIERGLNALPDIGTDVAQDKIGSPQKADSARDVPDTTRDDN